MTKQETSILIRIKNSIKQEDSNADIILFGSRARGDNRIVSDWDILILTDNSKTPDIEDRFRSKLYDIELETGQIISTLVYSKDYWSKKLKYSPLYFNVKKDGIHL